MSRLLKVFPYIIKSIYAKLSPVGYAKKAGVNMKGIVRFYGAPRLGTEPWLITLGDNVHITDNVRFITHDGGTLILRKIQPDLEITKPIVIGDDVYIGIDTIILPGVTIGSRCIIGAGSVVTRDIPDNSVAAGVPAKVIKSVDEYFEKAKAESLKLGHLSAKDKARELKRIYLNGNKAL